MRTGYVRSFLLAICIVLVTVATGWGWNYPEKTGYAAIPTINTADLAAHYEKNSCLIVDVRSEIEYKTVHIDGAVHIPLSSKLFVDELKKELAKNKKDLIAFYCNGGSCLKAPAASK